MVGFYLRGRSSTGEDFFLAGREMTAWIAGLSFLSANLGSLELMGWAAAAYQYGILARTRRSHIRMYEPLVSICAANGLAPSHDVNVCIERFSEGFSPLLGFRLQPYPEQF